MLKGLAQFGPTLQEFRQLLRELSRLSNRFERHPTRFLLGGDQPEGVLNPNESNETDGWYC